MAARDALAPELRARASRAIAERIAALPDFGRARSIALFASIGSEVDTAPIEAAVRMKNARPCYPRLEAGALAFYVAYADELSPEGRFRIPSPPAVDERRVDLSTVDFFVVPGLCFDAARHRLGYGRGYYDRALTAAPRAKKVAVAFDAQIVSSVPVEYYDVAMDAVVTETRVL